MKKETVVVLGRRGDSWQICEGIESLINGKVHKIIGLRSKFELENYLDTNAVKIADQSFKTEVGMDDEDEFVEMSKYKTDSIYFFLCSTVLRNDTGEYAWNIADGFDFAKNILPEVPKIIIHNGQNPIDLQTVEQDFHNKVFHVSRYGDNFESIINKILHKGEKFSFDDYLNIIGDDKDFIIST